VSNLASGSTPTVTINNSNITSPILNFGLVQGIQGIQGVQGPNGAPGYIDSVIGVSSDVTTNTQGFTTRGTNLISKFESFLYDTMKEQKYTPYTQSNLFINIGKKI
jgi:hypothetical protein